jgi:hypothetical protein
VKLSVNIKIELCEYTLKNIVNEINADQNMKKDRTLTSTEYFITSQIFIEVLGVNFLHKRPSYNISWLDSRKYSFENEIIE